MRLAQLGAGAALAGMGQAFLIPSTMVHGSTSKEIADLPFATAAIASERVFEVECPGCPVKTTGEGLMKWGHAESMLRLNVSVVDTDKLMINNLQVYPIDLSINRLVKSLTADQLVKTPDGTWAYTSSQQLGYALRMRHPRNKAAASKDDLDLISFHLEIIEVGNKFVRGIPALDIMVVKTNNGQLGIGNARVQVSKGVNTPAKDCKTLLCKWRAAIAAKASGLRKGCGNKGRPSSRPHYAIKGGPNKFNQAPRPHGSFHHGHRRPHSSFAKVFRSIVLHLLLPILVGIALGITASLVGFVVGQIAIFCWRLVFRRGERAQYCRVKQDEASNGLDDETKGFLDNQGPPPVYEVVIIEEKTEQK